jgi:PilZ domain
MPFVASKIDLLMGQSQSVTLKQGGVSSLDEYCSSQSSFGALSSEFLGAALRAAVIASMVNRRAVMRELLLPTSVELLLPGLPETFTRLNGSAIACFYDRSLTNGLAEFYEDLESAKAQTPKNQAAWTNLSSIGNGISDGLDWHQLRLDWQSICGRARLIAIVLCQIDFITGDEQVSRLLETERLLKGAWCGGTPCIRSDGFVVVPGWADARSDRRCAINSAVWVHSVAGRHDAALKNISTTGLGLTLQDAVGIGTDITIEFADGLRLSGVVQWSNGPEFGVQFHAPLNDDHQILKEALLLSRASVLAAAK